jgi:hypothetical protein
MQDLHAKFRLFLFTVVTLCLSLSSASAQELDQLYVSEQGRFTFRYPSNWAVAEGSDLFVSITDGDINMEFYYQSVAGMILDLSTDPEQTLAIFQDIMSVDVASNANDMSMLRPVQSLRALLNALVANSSSGVPLIIGGQAVVGMFNIENGRGEYVFLIRGDLLQAPGYTFVRVTGGARRLLADRALILAIIETFGSLVSPDEFGPAPQLPTATQPPAPTATSLPTNTPTPTPCTIRALGAGETSVHVGPGNNRSSIRFLEAGRDFEVIGTADARDGSQWWRVDKQEAAASQALQVNETWVAAAEVTESGDCDRVGTVAPPPIVPLPQPTAVPTSITLVAPTPIPGSNQPSISFIADRNSISEGECVNLIWDVRNAREVIWRGEPYAAQALFTVCPPSTTTYQLLVVTLAGETVSREVTVNVGPPGEGPPRTEEPDDICINDMLPAAISDSIPVGGSDTFSFNVDPCLSPAPIQVSMDATNRMLDPYIEVTVFFVDGRSAFYSNDDVGDSTDASLIIPTQSNINRIAVVARSFSNASGGSYRLSVRRVATY